MDDLNLAIQQKETTRSHEPGIHRQDERMDAVFRRDGTITAGDVGQFLGD